MSKPSKRPGRAARDVHSLIREEAAQLRAAGGLCIDEAANYPHCEELLNAIRQAIESTLPPSVMHEGRRYYVTTRLPGLQFEVFANPGDSLPLIACASGSFDPFGHTPGH